MRRAEYCANALRGAGQPVSRPTLVTQARHFGRLVRYHPETSYWQGDANEMVAINTILIIVNSRARKGLTVPQNSCSGGRIWATLRQKQGELAADTQYVPLTISMIGCRKSRRR